MPPGAAELAVGDGLAGRPLPACVMTRSISRSSTAFRSAAEISPLARFSRASFSAAGTQQAADMVGAERWLGAFHALHPHTSSAISTIIAQLRPLLVLGQRIAFLGRGEAALRRKAELIERRELRRLVDAAQDRVAAFELSGLRGDEAEHDGLALGQEAQRLEAAGALGVVLHEVAVHLDRVEQDLGDRLVAAARHEGGAEIAAAEMHRDRHVGRDIRHRGVDHARIGQRQRVRIVAARAHVLAQRRDRTDRRG